MPRPLSCAAATTILLLSLLAAAPAPALTITSIAQGSVVPANWLHPIIEWEDPAPADASYEVTIRAGSGSPVITRAARGRRLVLTDDAFAEFLKQPSVSFTVSRADAALGRIESTVSVGVDPARLTDSVIYRMVEPLFNPAQDAVIKILRLEDAEPRGIPAVAATCVGCHA
jgi:hypothetical protein